MPKTIIDDILNTQRGWAAGTGLTVDDRGYLPDVSSNLHGGLSPAVRAAFENADGNELTDRSGQPAKMRALISSSALAVNVFQHWTLRDPSPLGAVLGLQGVVTHVEFERRLPTGAPGTPPNLDVVLTLADGGVVGIESKFTEWMKRDDSQAGSMAPYFRASPSLWEHEGLVACAHLARAVYEQEERFEYLNVPQLLKHALGLHRAGAATWSLGYVWYDLDGVAGEKHRQELQRFADAVGKEVALRSLSYQELFMALECVPAIDHAYLSYLVRRYGAPSLQGPTSN
jgi:hypothetical protein